MSAIAGIFFFDGAPVEPGLIEKLTAAMKNRGPDEQTHWVQGSIALGHCMLRTTPESIEEHQPLISQDKNLVLVWDGRLDNREELKRDLKSAGAVQRDNSDAELVLNSYAIWGEECPKHLLGDFAFAVWDIRQRKLFCSRDHLGGKPIYYTQNSDFFAFASEEGALPKLPGVSSTPNDERIAYFLVPEFNNFDTRQSWIRDIWALSPAQTLVVTHERKFRTETYWHLMPREESFYATDESCVEDFLGVFSDAVRCRLRTIGKPAVMVSGGMDSASIVAMVKRLMPETPDGGFNTYSAISDHPETCVESRSILSLTKDIPGKAHFVSVPSMTDMIGIEDLIDVVYRQADPVGNSILIPALMCLAASRQGDRVLLHGASGDITMHVPNRYIAYLLRSGLWRQAFEESKMIGRSHKVSSSMGFMVHLLLNSWTAFMPEVVKNLVRYLRGPLIALPLEEGLINDDFAAKLQLAERMRAQKVSVPFDGNLQRAHVGVLEGMYGIVSAQTACERVAQRYGVEPRDPWADRRVVEFFLRLPLKYKIRHGWRKYLARTAFEEDLEPAVRQRQGKEHLGWDIIVRSMDYEPWKVSQIIKDRLDSVANYVDVEAVRTRFSEYENRHDASAQQSIFNVVTLMLWLERVSNGKL